MHYSVNGITWIICNLILINEINNSDYNVLYADIVGWHAIWNQQKPRYQSETGRILFRRNQCISSTFPRLFFAGESLILRRIIERHVLVKKKKRNWSVDFYPFVNVCLRALLFLKLLAGADYSTGWVPTKFEEETFHALLGCCSVLDEYYVQDGRYYTLKASR